MTFLCILLAAARGVYELQKVPNPLREVATISPPGVSCVRCGCDPSCPFALLIGPFPLSRFPSAEGALLASFHCVRPRTDAGGCTQPGSEPLYGAHARVGRARWAAMWCGCRRACESQAPCGVRASGLGVGENAVRGPRASTMISPLSVSPLISAAEEVSPFVRPWPTTCVDAS